MSSRLSKGSNADEILNANEKYDYYRCANVGECGVSSAMVTVFLAGPREPPRGPSLPSLSRGGDRSWPPYMCHTTVISRNVYLEGVYQYEKVTRLTIL